MPLLQVLQGLRSFCIFRTSGLVCFISKLKWMHAFFSNLFDLCCVVRAAADCGNYLDSYASSDKSCIGKTKTCMGAGRRDILPSNQS
jgi:hypothetical protein